ncbi:MAG: HigA family addiction module antidote protein, partial [Proteobacteria bacterium]|nr:HigA family addiction module antidote protein [Pseudomonadota bacterium]
MSKPSNNSHPGYYVRHGVIPKGMSVTQAAKTIGVGRPALSNFLNGNASLSSEMAMRLQKAFGADPDELMKLQAEHDACQRASISAISMTTRTFVPPFLEAVANDIETWADAINSRSKLAVLLRILVNSTCEQIRFIDFPGNDDAQRPGWDGRVET